MSKAKARGYANLAQYRIDLQEVKDYCTTQDESVFVEIGFGNGEVLAQFAQQHPNWRCLGIDVYRPGIGDLVNLCIRSDLNNVRIVEDEAITVLEQIPAASIDLLYVLFPDPWPKLRHHRRRLVDSEFAALVRRNLTFDGAVYLATDSEDYAAQIREAMSATLFEINCEQVQPFPQTRYRQKAQKAGHQIWDLEYRRINL